MGRCASPTRSSSAGIECPAAPVSRRCASPRPWWPTTDVTLIGVAGRHAHVPDDPWSPPIPIAHLPVGGPLLYDLWLRAQLAEGRAGHRPDRRCPRHDADPVRRPMRRWWSPCTTWRSCTIRRSSPGAATASSGAASITSADAPTSCCAAARRRWTTASPPASTPIGLRLVPLGVESIRADADEIARVRARCTACPSATCCSSARSSRARTCAVWPRRSRCSTSRCRSSSPAPRVGATSAIPHRAATSASSASCPPATSVGCTPAPRCSATRASARGTGCRCSRRWRRARRSSPVGAPPPRRPPAAPPCWSIRSTPTDIARGISEARAAARRGCPARRGRAPTRQAGARPPRLTADAYRELC